MDYACPIWRSAVRTRVRKLQVLESRSLGIATIAPWYICNKQILEDLEVLFFADHIRALTESDNSTLTGVGNSVIWQQGRCL